MPNITDSCVERLADADTEIRDNDIDLTEGYEFQILFDKNSINNSVDYIDIWLPTIFYNSPIKVARTLLKVVTAYIASKKRIKNNMKDPVKSVEPFAIGFAYKKDSSVIRFYSQTHTSFSGMVMYKSTEDLLHLL